MTNPVKIMKPNAPAHMSKYIEFYKLYKATIYCETPNETSTKFTFLYYNLEQYHERNSVYLNNLMKNGYKIVDVVLESPED